MVDSPTERLPRGRHHLTRQQVEDSQRGRILVAMAEAMADKGYLGTSVADVLTRARVSRETFYQQFSSKLDCFMHAFDAAGDVVLARIGESHPEAGATPVERFERAFTAYIETLAQSPAQARVFLVEVYAAGPEALDRRAALQARIVDGMAELLGAREREDQFACQVLVAAISTLVTGPVVARDTEALERLRSEVVALVRRALAREGPAACEA